MGVGTNLCRHKVYPARRRTSAAVNVAQFRTLHRYGALLSLAIATTAAAAFALNAPESIVLICGFAGSLGSFYFVGTVLEDSRRYRVVGEELLRGVVWYFASLIGWSVLVTAAGLPTTPVTAVWLPALTALGLSLSMVALRRMTGLDLTAQTESGQLLVAVGGGVVGGFVVLYLVLVDGRPPWLLLLYAGGSVAGLAVWRWQWNRREAA